MSDLGRRIVGTLFGGLMGLVYALVSELINRIALPGIPIYSPPPGLAGSILLTILMGLGIGLVTSWPESSMFGIFLGGLFSAIIMILGTFFNVIGTNESFGVMSIMTLYLFLPMIVVALPVSGLIRWSTHSLIPADIDTPINLKKGLLPLAITLVLTALVGGLSLYSGMARTSLRGMNVIVQNGTRASSDTALPEPLQSVSGFLDNAQGRYALEWDDGPGKFQGQRLATASDRDQGTVTVHFDNGFSFVCLFIPQAVHPVCENQ